MENTFIKIKSAPSHFPEDIKKFINNGDDYTFLFPSKYDVINFMVNNKDYISKTGHTSSMEFKRSFTEVSSYDEMLSIFKNGSGYTDNIIKKYDDLIVDEKEFPQSEYLFDVTGEFLDVGEFLSGGNEPFVSSSDAFKKERYADIVINSAYNCGVEAGTVIDSAAAVIAAVKILEKQSIRVKVTAISASTLRSKHFTILTPVKEYQESIDYKKLSAYTHPVYHRVFLFKLEEVAEMATGGYGHPEQFRGAINLGQSNTVKSILKKITIN